MLAVTAGLRRLLPEPRRRVPRLPRRHLAMLDEGADDRCRALGPQREAATALVLELVHLLADDVGRLPHTAPEDADVLEQRAHRKAVACPPGDAREDRHEALPARALRRQDVLSSLWRLVRGERATRCAVGPRHRWAADPAPPLPGRIR